MLTDYLNKVMQTKKTLEDMEREAKLEHKVKLIHEIGGKKYASFHDPGTRIRDKRGKIYVVDEHGALVREKK